VFRKWGHINSLDCFKGYLGFEFWWVALSFSHRTLLCLEILTKGVVRLLEVHLNSREEDLEEDLFDKIVEAIRGGMN
jgi:hypothetical protein